jgi:uncharacterized protein GlcG (DUF336 family)
MTRITLDQANTLIAAAFAHGADAKLKPLAAAVLDAGGHLIAFQRQDGASIGRLQVAVGKASGALFLGVSSRKIADMAAERPACGHCGRRAHHTEVSSSRQEQDWGNRAGPPKPPVIIGVAAG